MKSDIQNREDLELLIKIFYDKLLADKEVSSIFDNLDLIHHLPKIVDFWEFVLLEKSGYKTNVFDQHIHLNLSQNDFKVWLKHFRNTCIEHFEGEKTNMAMERATQLANTFYYKLSGEYYSF